MEIYGIIINLRQDIIVRSRSQQHIRRNCFGYVRYRSIRSNFAFNTSPRICNRTTESAFTNRLRIHLANYNLSIRSTSFKIHTKAFRAVNYICIRNYRSSSTSIRIRFLQNCSQRTIKIIDNCQRTNQDSPTVLREIVGSIKTKARICIRRFPIKFYFSIQRVVNARQCNSPNGRYARFIIDTAIITIIITTYRNPLVSGTSIPARCTI